MAIDQEGKVDLKEMQFFSLESSQDLIRDAVRKLKSYQFDEEIIVFMIDAIVVILSDMSNKPEIYDRHCSANIEWIGENFFGYLRLISSERPNKDALERVLFVAFRFLSEREFNIDIDQLSPIYDVRQRILGRLPDFAPGCRNQLTYAAYTMPADILKRLVRHPSIQAALDFEKSGDKFSKARDDAEKELEIYHSKVSNLKLALESYKDAFNFVGLHDGFRRLCQKKSAEVKYLLIGLSLIAGSMVGLLCMEAILLKNQFSVKDFNAITVLASSFPIFAIELLLVYFFRIVLGQFQSARKQILQLDLRMALCQFIQSYADYSKEIKEKDKSALEKFEGLIFSGIVGDDQALPSTFDGIEQISKLVDAIRGKRG